MLTCFFAGLFVVARYTIAWARRLPERIHIHVDEEALAKAVSESTRLALRGDDPVIQLQVLNFLADGINQNPDATDWIHDEYYDDLVPLRESKNEDVVAKADELLQLIDASGKSLEQKAAE